MDGASRLEAARRELALAVVVVHEARHHVLSLAHVQMSRYSHDDGSLACLPFQLSRKPQRLAARPALTHSGKLRLTLVDRRRRDRSGWWDESGFGLEKIS